MLVLMFPREQLGLPPDMMRQLTAHRFSSTDGLGAMIIPFLQNVSQNLDRVGGATGPRLVHTAIDLITTMFANELDLEADPRDSHQLLMQQVRHYIETNLGSPELSPSQIAAAHFISTRHLHGLLPREGYDRVDLDPRTAARELSTRSHRAAQRPPLGWCDRGTLGIRRGCAFLARLQGSV